MNVVNFEVQRQNHEQINSVARKRDNDRNIMEAMWYGIENSRWSKDPTDPNAPGSLGFFMKHICDEAPAFFMQLMAKYCIEPPKD